MVMDGKSQTEAAKVFGVSRTAACLLAKAYRENGEKALKTKRQGRPKSGRLNRERMGAVKKSILGRCPDQLRLPGLLWTRDLVSELIERRYGIDISRWTAGRYLKAWPLSPQKPAKRALERNPAQASDWLKRKHPEIRRQAKEENARIWRGDETGLRSDHQTETTWGEKGRRRRSRPRGDGSAAT